MNSPPDALPLAELQARFAAALRAGADDSSDSAIAFSGCVVDDGLAPAARLQVYRNNVRATFERALARSFPVLKRRVGDEYFARLSSDYGRDHPSQSGDLHWAGRRFPEWIGSRLDGTDYAWLADLARLEWACEEALVSERLPVAPGDSLARVRPEELSDAMLSLQPALRLVSSRFPVWSVWQANQPGLPGDAIDPSIGAQWVAIVPVAEGLVLHSLAADRFRFIEQLAAGRALGEALDSSGLAVERLGGALAWLYGAGLVIAVSRRD